MRSQLRREPSTLAFASVGWAFVLVLLAGRPASAQTLPHGIPDFCGAPTIVSVASGRWSSASTWSAGRVPAAGDAVRVALGTAVEYDLASNAALRCVGILGRLAVRTDINTRMRVGTLMVMHGGELEIGKEDTPVAAGVTAEIIIADQAIDTAADPERFGTGLIGFGTVRIHGAPKSPTFVRLAAEPRAGQTTLTLAQGVSGWRVGDRIILPDTRQLDTSERFDNLQPQFEEFTITQISGTQLTVNRPLTFDHDGARSAQDVLELLPHVGNLTRNVVIRSEAPTGTRGHTLYTHHANVDIRYALFKDLGRTTNDPLGPQNQIGRYPLHIHHVMGPHNHTNTGYQFVLAGNAITDSLKWPLTVHNSHYGSIRDNVVFNGLGAGFVTEDGNESYNEFVHNFGVGIFGDENPRDTDGRDGSIFWFSGFNHIVRDNVAANAVNRRQAIVNGSGYNFTWPAASTASTRIPLFRGADVSVDGEYRFVNMQLVNIPEFSGNEVYGATPTGLVVWHLGTDGYDVSAPMTETLIRNFTAWHVHESAFFGYPSHNMTFDGFVVRGHRRALSDWDFGTGWWVGDYKNRNVTIRRADIQGMANGFDLSQASEGTVLIEDSYFSNFKTNITSQTLATPGSAATPNPRTTIVRNTRFVPMPGAPSFIAIQMYWTLDAANSYPQTPDRLFVYDYNGNAGQNYRVFYPQQASQNIAGGTATCTTTRAEFIGLVCPITGPVAPRVTSVSPPTGAAAGGSAVSISGASFRSGAVVEFGGLPATNVVVQSATLITARTPAHADGIVSVSVTQSDGQRGRRSDGYTYGSGPVPCTFELSAAGSSVPAAGGIGSVSVATAPSCAWVANSQDPRVVITSGSSGTGSGTVLYSVPANPTAVALSSVLVVAGHTFTVTQQASQTCAASVAPAILSSGSPGGTETTSISTGSACGWSAVSHVSWATITSASSGAGSMDINVAFAANTGGRRTGTLTIAGQVVSVVQGPPLPMARSSFDHDGRGELAIYRPSTGTWYLRFSGSEFSLSDWTWYQWGFPEDTPLSGDFDGDGLTDLVVWRPSNGTWYVRFSSNGYSLAGSTGYQWGLPGDIPLIGDFDGDNISDLTVWRPSDGTWYLRYSSSGFSLAGSTSYQWGLPGDQPVAGDYDGDGITDLTVYRPSTGEWFFRYSSSNYDLSSWRWYQWGLPGDVPLAGDFDGDGKGDLAVYRPSNGTWYLRFSLSRYSYSSATSYQWGLPGDLPVLTDFDGDGLTDLVVWRPTDGTWYIRYSSLSYGLAGWTPFQWGLPLDRPVGAP